MYTFYERDNGCCISCGRYVCEGTKAHHIIFKSKSGGDTMDHLVMPYMDCHHAVHHGGGKFRNPRKPANVTSKYDLQDI